MTEVSQKEYLKKYLGIGKAPGDKKKKKKKKDKIGPKRVKIIDDDADANINVIPDTDALDEDAPQIVAIVDERPPSLRVDEKTNSHLWTPIGSVPSTNTKQSAQKLLTKSFKLGGKQDEDTNKNSTDANESTTQEGNVERDISPPRKRKYDGDCSPPRRRSDNGDLSPPRKDRQIVYNSPPRKRSDTSIKIMKNDDISPPRKRIYDADSLPIKRTKIDDLSSPRKQRSHDNSPQRRRKDSASRGDQTSHNKTPPPRKINTEKDESRKMQTTLDGRKAGLQDARQLVDENLKFRKRENELFQTISTEQSGVNAVPVVRDRKTGKIRNMEEEQEHQRRKQEADEKRKEKYSRWGRGLKQVENYEEKLQNDLYEMSKPLARYADDEDLERYLKEQERDGDPMLAYIRKKKRKEAQEKGVEIKPKFEGEFMPNRYGIRPGHRWDGVDRSNGYEKRWFEIQNAKRVEIEDSYKWSTEDM